MRQLWCCFTLLVEGSKKSRLCSGLGVIYHPGIILARAVLLLRSCRDNFGEVSLYSGESGSTSWSWTGARSCGWVRHLCIFGSRRCYLDDKCCGEMSRWWGGGGECAEKRRRKKGRCKACVCRTVRSRTWFHFRTVFFFVVVAFSSWDKRVRVERVEAHCQHVALGGKWGSVLVDLGSTFARLDVWLLFGWSVVFCTALHEANSCKDT